VQAETKTTIDRTSGSNGASISVLRFSGDISSTSKESVLGAWQTVNGTGPVLMEADKTGQRVAAFGLTPHFQKVFTMVGISKYAGLFKDEPTASASL